MVKSSLEQVREQIAESSKPNDHAKRVINDACIT
jgi:hypothetical protein